MNPNPRPSPPWKGLESRTGEGAGGAAERLRESLVRAPRASLPSLGQLSRPGDVHLLAQRPVCVGVCPHGPHGTPLGRHARGPCFTVTVRAEREGAERSRRCSSHNSATLQLGHLGEAMRLPARLDAGLTPRACPPRRQAWVGVARPGTDPGVRGLPAGPRLPGAVCASGRRGQGLRAGTHFASPCPGTGCWRSDGDTEHPAELGAPPRGLRSSPATLVTVPGDGFWGGGDRRPGGSVPQHPKTHRTRVTEHRLHLALRRAAGAASAVAAHRGPPGQHGARSPANSRRVWAETRERERVAREHPRVT